MTIYRVIRVLISRKGTYTHMGQWQYSNQQYLLSVLQIDKTVGSESVIVILVLFDYLDRQIVNIVAMIISEDLSNQETDSSTTYFSVYIDSPYHVHLRHLMVITGEFHCIEPKLWASIEVV